MIKNVSRLEHKIGERMYHLTCDSDSPLAEVKESLFQFLKYIGQIEDSVKLQREQEQKLEESKKQEALKVDESKFEELNQSIG